MGAIPRTLRRPALRPLLLALLAAVAWLVWGAGTASASSLVPDTADPLKPASSLLADAIPPEAPPVVAGTGAAAVATAASLATPVTGLANSLAAPALPVLAGAVDSVTALVPGLPELPLVQAPLPLPLPDILPLPDELPPLLPELPSAPLPLPLPDLPLPGLPPLTTPAPGPVPTAAPSLPASDAVAGSDAPLLSPAAASAAAQTGLAGTAAPNTLRFGFAPAQDRAGIAAPPQAAPSGPEDGSQEPGTPAPPALANQAGQANSGSSGPVTLADLGGSWPTLPTPASAPNLSGAETLPAGPSFDPGSSPD
ncbi:hypothetical protein [Arthrobacter sp. S39]|uniref:hypothetical protein n=1 Tax=Arthrobacter sp. S39 TaxID=2509720 RepID=UPI0010374E75|nr:hypothetical protein [Arthrobacter sp. S39]TAP44536.1 hypothetical protein EYS21_08520 [Arthrobacter sp. S39]